jgi:hypothetical protein
LSLPAELPAARAVEKTGAKTVRFSELSPEGQVALAAWAVLVKSFPLEPGEVAGVPCGLNRALGDICTTVGLRTRRRHNNQRRHDYPGIDVCKKLRPAKRKVTKK